MLVRRSLASRCKNSGPVLDAVPSARRSGARSCCTAWSSEHVEVAHRPGLQSGTLSCDSTIDDASVYDHLKLMGRFVRLAGFSGMVVCLDELVNLYKMSNSRSRTNNYEQILPVLN